MYKINIVCVGDLKEKFYILAQDEYLKRIKHFCDINVAELQPEKLSNNPSKLEIEKALSIETNKILPHLKGQVLVCAVEGREYTSETFAKNIFEKFDTSDTLTFVIGSSYGLSKTLKQQYPLVSFSKMTLPHHLMRIMLEEQIYRAFTIKENMTYHK